MEQVSAYAKHLIEQLLNVHALACYARVSDKNGKEHMNRAKQWVPTLEATMNALKRELEKETK